jgi:hypothetical protein
MHRAYQCGAAVTQRRGAGQLNLRPFQVSRRPCRQAPRIRVACWLKNPVMILDIDPIWMSGPLSTDDSKRGLSCCAAEDEAPEGPGGVARDSSCHTTAPAVAPVPASQ